MLTASRPLAAYYEEILAAGAAPKIAANWVMGEVTRGLNDNGLEIAACPVTPQLLAELLALIDKGTISGKIAKTVFDDMWQSGKRPEEIVAEKGLVQVSDTGAIEKIIDEIMAANMGQVEEYRGGKEKVFGFFVGQVMRASKGTGESGGGQRPAAAEAEGVAIRPPWWHNSRGELFVIAQSLLFAMIVLAPRTLPFPACLEPALAADRLHRRRSADALRHPAGTGRRFQPRVAI